MSTQPTPIILKPGVGSVRDEPGLSDLQQVITRVLGILSRRRWPFALPVLSGILVSLSVSLLLPRHYSVRTMFERRDDVVLTQLVHTNTPYSFVNLRRSLIIDLKGYNALNRVVEDLGLTRNLPRAADGTLTTEDQARKRRLVDDLAGQITVNSVEKSSWLDMIEVQYLGPDPELGTKTVSRLRDNYQAMMRERVAQLIGDAHLFFTKEAQQREERAVALAAEQLRYAAEYPEVNPNDPNWLEEQMQRQADALGDLTRRQGELSSRIATREQYLRELNPAEVGGRRSTSQPAGPEALRGPNPRYQQVAAEIERLRTDIAELKATRGMKDEHPQVKALWRKIDLRREELESLPEVIAAEPVTPAPMDAAEGARARAQANMELASLKDQLSQIDRDIETHRAERASLEQRKSKLLERRQEYLRREEEMRNLRGDFMVWSGNQKALAQVLVAETQDRGIQFSTLEEVRAGSVPETPSLKVVYALSGGFGLLLGAIVVFLCEIFDRSFRHPARVRQALGIPILETIGEICARPKPGWLDREKVLPALAAVEGVMVLALVLVVYISLMEPAVYGRLVALVTSPWPF